MPRKKFTHKDKNKINPNSKRYHLRSDPDSTQGTYNIIRTLSKLGYCSRKEALKLVQGGLVSVNSKIVRDPGLKIKNFDKILVEGKPPLKKKLRYLMLNKPAGYITTRHDELGRKTVYELLGNVKDWVFPVGRLDMDSEGLLIFTNDTQFGERLTNPKSNIPRVYEVKIDKPLDQEEISLIRQGVDIGRSEISKPTTFKALNPDDLTFFEITLAEGKNREPRRLFEKFGKSVLHLKRIKYGPYELRDLRPGQWKEIVVSK